MGKRRHADAAVTDDQLSSSSKLPIAAAPAAVPVVIGVVVLFTVLVAVVVRTGVFDSNTSASDTRIVAAMLTLLGGLIASAFTLVGVLLKHSIDRHAVLLAAEAERSRRLEAREIEHRLRLETSVKAVELLTMPDGQPAPPERQAGALVVLGSPPLRQLELALALLGETWQSGQVKTSAALWVINRALLEPDEDLQTEAAQMLSRHTGLLVRERSFQVPMCVDVRWPKDASYLGRQYLILALCKLIAGRKPDQWSPGARNHFIGELHVIHTTETAGELRSNTARIAVRLALLHCASTRSRRAERVVAVPVSGERRRGPSTRPRNWRSAARGDAIVARR